MLVAAAARALRLPTMLGYLVTGIAIGPFALGWIPESEEARYLAEFGVVFLMFSIGLEFSLPRLMTMRMTVFGFGGAQVVLTIVLTALIAWLLDLPLLAASRWAASCRCRPPPSCRSCWPSGWKSRRRTGARFSARCCSRIWRWCRC